ncbi:MAG: hypothetical protein Q8Q55_00900 [Undibacterium sp.]|nr:hypothetical protein [Undibacterium sp.]
MRISLSILLLLSLATPAEAQLQSHRQDKEANLQRRLEMRQALMEARQAARHARQKVGDRQRSESANNSGSRLSPVIAESIPQQPKRWTMEERQALRKQIRDARNEIYGKKRP